MSATSTFMRYWRIVHLRRGATFALIGAGLSYWVGTEHLAQAQRNFAVARDIRIEAASAQAALEARQALSERFLQISAQTDGLEQKFDANMDRSALVERMATLSSETGTRIVHGSNSFGKERLGVTPLLQDLTVEGTYEDIRAFLAAVHRLETLTFVISVELSANPDGTVVRGKMQFMTLAGDTG